jgi:hypothetical protein
VIPYHINVAPFFCQNISRVCVYPNLSFQVLCCVHKQANVIINSAATIKLTTPKSFAIRHDFKCLWVNAHVWGGIVSDHISLADMSCSYHSCYLLPQREAIANTMSHGHI